MTAPNDNALYPLHVFRFQIDFVEVSLDPGKEDLGDISLCSGAFSQCSGLEATMEPKVIKEGGRNYGAAQRAGPVTFATVILKRGITSTRHLWQWFALMNEDQKYAHRLNATITLHKKGDTPILAWTLQRAMPIKFKVPDLNATANQVGVEELHLAHEGLTVKPIL